MASRSLDDLAPVFRPYALAFRDACHAAGLDVLIYCTLRSLAEQADLYAQGRTAPGKRVTNAPPGSSAHNYGLALDGVPLVAGKAVWTTAGLGADLWRRYGDCARAAGCEWAGDWTRFREYPHVQMPDWRTHR